MSIQTKKLYTKEVATWESVKPILTRIPDEELNYFKSFMDMSDFSTSVLSSEKLLSENYIPQNGLENIISLDSINQIPYLNKFIKRSNQILPEQGILAGRMYPKEIRKKAMRQTYSSFLFYPLYFLDFIWHRVFCKLKFTRPLYKKLNGETPRVLVLAETLGRIAAGGFEIIDYQQFGSQVFFVARKVRSPSFEATKSHGFIFKMSRISKGGEKKDFYKIRTMHLYAEYLQGFIYKRNGLSNGDKFNDDFRITTWGKVIRKYWLDELPMIFNLLRGDLKLVGVRPLSNQKFNLYTKELQKFRTKFKPGLIPPYYADMPGSLEETMDSELKYLKAYEKHPIKTDIKYLFKAIYNIIIKKARSN